MAAHVETTVAQGVATLRLNRPERLNALGSGPGSNREALLAAVRGADGDPAIGCIVIAGAGRAFCGGGDMTGNKPRETAYDDEMFLLEVEQFHAALRSVRKPLVAAVHGLCLGAGLALIAQCDLVVAADDALFGLQEGRIGLSGASHIVDIVGPMWAKFMILTGENIDAQRAQRIGLVLEVLPAASFAADVQELARRIASLPRESTVLNKAAIDAQVEASGRAAGRLAAMPHDALTTAMAREARAPDGRLFRDILRDEGIEGLKRARQQQYDTPWLGKPGPERK